MAETPTPPNGAGGTGGIPVVTLPVPAGIRFGLRQPFQLTFDVADRARRGLMAPDGQDTAAQSTGTPGSTLRR
jgi:hypothetical protein